MNRCIERKREKGLLKKDYIRVTGIFETKGCQKRRIEKRETLGESMENEHCEAYVNGGQEEAAPFNTKVLSRCQNGQRPLFPEYSSDSRVVPSSRDRPGTTPHWSPRDLETHRQIVDADISFDGAGPG